MGVDSPPAIRFAREKAERKGVNRRFIVADLLGDLHEMTERFDFAFGWEVLHHIFPEDQETYIRNVYTVLTLGAHYFSVFSSEQDP